MTDILVIFIKWPEPGMVKTRIGRVLGHDKAAKLYRYMVLRVIENLSPLLTKDMKICWYFNSISKTREVKNWIKNEMYALNINDLSNQIFCHQVGSDLGEKLQFVFNKYLSEGFAVILSFRLFYNIIMADFSLLSAPEIQVIIASNYEVEND